MRDGAPGTHTHITHTHTHIHTPEQVQDVMRKWGGSFLQFRCDEKGYVGICAFGLAGHTHADNPSRGIQSSLELRRAVLAGGHRVCIGVTTGQLLCTCVGARKIRSEFTVSAMRRGEGEEKGRGEAERRGSENGPSSFPFLPNFSSPQTPPPPALLHLPLPPSAPSRCLATRSTSLPG